MAYEASLLGNTKPFTAALDKAGSSVEDLVEDLKTLDRAGEKSGDSAGKAMDEIADSSKTAGKSVETLEDKYDDLARTVKRTGDDAGDGLNTGFRKGTDGAKEGLEEVKRESASTAKESAASFDGSAESIVDAFQEVAANAFAGFGPAGLVAGLAAAAGIGLIVSAMEQGGESTEDLKERVSELTAELINAGQKGGPSLDYMVDKLKDLAASTEDGKDNLNDLADAADKAGLQFDKIAKAYVGNSKALKDLISDNEKYVEALEEQAQLASESGDEEKYSSLLKQAQAVERLTDTLRTNLGVTKEAEEAEAHWLASGGPEMEAKAAHIEAINDAYDEAAEGAEDFINKESGLFDVGAFITSMQNREQAIRDYQDTLASTPLTPEAKAFLDSQGVQSAATFLQGYKAATPAQQAELNRIWTETGRQNSGTYAANLQGGMPATINGPTVVVNTDAAERALAQLARNRTVTINASGNITRIGNQVW